MHLDGTVELEGASTDDAWAVFSDPVAIREALPGCKRIAPARAAADSPAAGSITGDASRPVDEPGDATPQAFREGDEYVAVIQAGTRSIKPRFESVVRITERAFPRMSAHVQGAGGESAFDMNTEVEFADTDEGVAIAWTSEFDIAGRLGQVDSSILTLLSEKMVEHFFDEIAQQVRGPPA